MLLFLFLLPSAFLTITVGRNETKGNLSTKQIDQQILTTASQVRQKKNKGKSTESN